MKFRIGKNFMIENKMPAACRLLNIHWYEMCYLAISIYAFSLLPDIYFISTRKKVYQVI